MDPIVEPRATGATNKTTFNQCFDNILSGEAHRDFQRVLKTCCSCLGPSTPCHSTAYAEVILTAFVPGVRSPLSKFVGTHNKALVLVSGSSVTTPSDAVHSQETPFTVHTFQQVATSRTARQQRHLLNTELPLLTNSSQSEEEKVVVDLGAKLVPMETASQVTSLYCQAVFADAQTDLPDLWVLCQGGINKVVAMGCSLGEPSSAKRHSLRTFTIREGTSLIVYVSNSKLKLNTIAPTSRRGAGPRCKPDNMREWWAYSEYDIAPSGDSECLSEDSQLLVQFVWSGADHVVCPPPSSAEAVLSLSVKPGYQFSPTLAIFNEVSILFHLASIAAGLKSWPNVDTEEPVTSSYPSLVSKVNTFLENAAEQMLMAVDSSIISPTAALSPFQPREDLDFLGQLWMFARHVASASDLVDALGLIFQAVLLGKVQPFIHHTKKSSLASLLRQAISSTTHDQHQVVATKLQYLLTPERALQCLLEIGIEKMERDYFTHFTTNELVASTQLEPFLVKETSLLEQCGALCQLHCVLEVVATAMTFLDLPQQSLSQLTKRALEFYQPTVQFKGFSTTPVFLIPFASNSVGLKSLANYTSSLKPHIWSLTGNKKEREKEKSCMTVCLAEPLFKSMQASNSVSSDNMDDTALFVYHGTSTTL